MAAVQISLANKTERSGTHLVVDFRKYSLALELAPDLVVQTVVKHLPELLSGLQTAGGENPKEKKKRQAKTGFATLADSHFCAPLQCPAKRT